ncbi:[acyl-carrier-protein] S-malonyltransferase [Candidatus Epulonipiscium fishelsonii]|uniref:[acyl-carrier-protein] S-malonyltransferase n=1 Tax=Candidatus Epulonipiscium fishelsonii TaxID=77094 RepID=A0ACC8XB71_9FIRM|nr:[acyl-carrier-protein] S-malonyltransferase [Epulopiscium sp. SCG-B11WGA-EpuloA1]ONI42040.1 [acyl-carrier-protein] S-malonyltransferase [Epulopiscium sp. SCG-B05WGA-EpuloA1]
MGKDMFENYEESRNLFDKANKLFKPWDIEEVCFEDPNGVLNQTEYTQVALFTTNLAVYEAVRKAGIKPDAMIGYSLGEYSALVASGILDFEDGLHLVEERSKYMATSAKAEAGTMSAVLGLDKEIIQAICSTLSVGMDENFVSISNDNCPGQVVISGTVSGVKAATEDLLKAGAKRVMPLNVSGAFHSELMHAASVKLEMYASALTFHDPKIPIVSNATADYMNGEEARKNMPIQTMKGVRFRESIERLINDGFDVFIEIGVKKTLSSFVKKISKDVTVLNVEDKKSLEKTLATLATLGY